MIKPSINTFPSARILVVDDNVANVELIARFLEWAGYDNVVLMTDSTAVMDAVHKCPPDIILLDLQMPKVSGYEILEALRGPQTALSFIPVLVFTAENTPEAKARAFEAGASDFLTKPGDAQEILLRVRNFLEVRRLHVKVEQYNAELEARVQMRTTELARARREALESLALVAEFRDDQTGLHTKRVGELSAAIAQEMGESEEFVDALRLTAPLHDIGKVGIPDNVLLKPGRYTPEERKIMHRHTEIGAKILARSESPLMILAQMIALYHHEHWDGSGYPNGTYGEAIPLAARIVAVADVYDALVFERPYKEAWTHRKAVEEIRTLAGKHFDPNVVRAFIQIMDMRDYRQVA